MAVENNRFLEFTSACKDVESIEQVRRLVSNDFYALDTSINSLDEVVKYDAYDFLLPDDDGNHHRLFMHSSDLDNTKNESIVTSSKCKIHPIVTHVGKFTVRKMFENELPLINLNLFPERASILSKSFLVPVLKRLYLSSGRVPNIESANSLTYYEGDAKSMEFGIRFTPPYGLEQVEEVDFKDSIVQNFAEYGKLLQTELARSLSID